MLSYDLQTTNEMFPMAWADNEFCWVIKRPTSRDLRRKWTSCVTVCSGRWNRIRTWLNIAWHRLPYKKCIYRRNFCYDAIVFIKVTRLIINTFNQQNTILDTLKHIFASRYLIIRMHIVCMYNCYVHLKYKIGVTPKQLYDTLLS